MDGARQIGTAVQCSAVQGRAEPAATAAVAAMSPPSIGSRPHLRRRSGKRAVPPAAAAAEPCSRKSGLQTRIQWGGKKEASKGSGYAVRQRLEAWQQPQGFTSHADSRLPPEAEPVSEASRGAPPLRATKKARLSMACRSSASAGGSAWGGAALASPPATGVAGSGERHSSAQQPPGDVRVLRPCFGVLVPPQEPQHTQEPSPEPHQTPPAGSTASASRLGRCTGT
jgi:hypothetical protein